MKNILSIMIVLIFIAFSGCSKNKDDKKAQRVNTINNKAKQLKNNKPKHKKFDPCDCNQKSQKIMNKTLALRMEFDSIDKLKSDQESKELIRKYATEYMELTKKCFEVNNARLMIESECNDLKKLEMKKDSLNALGIQIHQGATIRL